MSLPILLLFVPCLAVADEAPPVATLQPVTSLFYHSTDIGSEAQFNPFTVWVNSGFDILAKPSYRRSVLEVEYQAGFRNVFDNLNNGVARVRRVGIERVVAHEVFPYRGIDSQHGQWIPNVFGHMLGEGMLSRKLSDWYELQNVPYPRLWGLATLVATQFLNEAAENGSYKGTNLDPVVDLGLFNLLGYLLFVTDEVAGFFAGPVQLNYWPGQAVLDLRSGELFNHGENFAFKLWLGDWTNLRGFFYFGGAGLFGLSLPLGVHDAVSVAAGPHLMWMKPNMVNGNRWLQPAGDMNWDLALFWDRNESLLASVQGGGMSTRFVALNVYPGVWRLGPVGIGAYAFCSEDVGTAVGLTVQAVPVVPGVILGRETPRPAF